VALSLLVLAAFATTIGPVQRAVGQGMVQVFSLAGTEQISLNFPCTVSCFVNSATLANYAQTQPGGNFENTIVGGDSDLNLYQRGTTGASVTTTLTYGGPDRFAYWSGASTAMTVSRDTTAGDLPATKAFISAFKMARTSGQTGVVPVCMMQVVESVNSYAYSGQTAEVDFHATAGANFSAAASTMSVNIITGTGTDEGAAKAAFGLNAGGGGGSGWTTQANVTLNVPISTTNNRYTVVAPVPTGTTEIAVAFCFTPVGTASTNDYIAFSGVQLTRNSSLASAAGSAGIVLALNDTRAKSFVRRPQGQETALQQRYFFQLNEPAAGTPILGIGQVTTTNNEVIQIDLPQPMRIAPTTGTITIGGFKLNIAGTATTPTTLTAQANGNTATTATLASTTTATAGQATMLQGSGAGTGILPFSAEL
jgi:hypothetical protein